MKTIDKQLVGPAGNILLLAFLAEALENFLHEATHALVTLAVGGEVKTFSYWAVDSQWTANVPANFWGELLIAASAALLNIVCALIGIIVLAYSGFSLSPRLRLFIFYFTSYSLFAGFGYLFVDPLFANQDSLGDWGKVVMLLGGEWLVRFPISIIGAAGTVFGYFWMGGTALQLVANSDGSQQRQMGWLVCLMPYFLVNCLYSVLSFGHPLGIPGTIAMLLKLWMGFIGFFWAYMIKFIWVKPATTTQKIENSKMFEYLSDIPKPLILSAVIVISLIIYPLSAGLQI